MTSLHALAFINSTFGWLVVFFLALLLFGSRLPKVARNLGKGINEFKKGLNEGAEQGESDEDADDDRAPAPRRHEAAEARRTHIDDTSV